MMPSACGLLESPNGFWLVSPRRVDSSLMVVSTQCVTMNVQFEGGYSRAIDVLWIMCLAPEGAVGWISQHDVSWP